MRGQICNANCWQPFATLMSVEYELPQAAHAIFITRSQGASTAADDLQSDLLPVMQFQPKRGDRAPEPSNL